MATFLNVSLKEEDKDVAQFIEYTSKLRGLPKAVIIRRMLRFSMNRMLLSTSFKRGYLPRDIIAIGDVHIGRRDCDLPGLIGILEDIHDAGYRPSGIVFIGDVLDGSQKYWSQQFKQIVSKHHHVVQRLILDWLVEKIKKLFGLKNEDIFIVKGNHEEQYYDDLLLEYSMHKGVRYSNVIIIGNTLFIHRISKGGRGYSSIPPSDLFKAVVGLKGEYEQDFNLIVYGHVHRNYSKQLVAGTHVVRLPAFVCEEPAEKGFYQLVVPLIYTDEGYTIEFTHKRSKQDEINEFMEQILEEIIEDKLEVREYLIL